MKILLHLLMSFLFVLAVNVGLAYAVPDIRGVYSGSYEAHVSNCSNSDDNGIYNAILVMAIHSQAGNTFRGTATGSYDIDGSTVNEYIQLSGTISESGQISGITTHTFLASSGEGTFTGQLSGNTLFIENSGQDTSPGHTCTYIRYMSAVREPDEQKICPSDGTALDGFGRSVSISGGYAIVGSPADNDFFRAGAAYIFEIGDSAWNQVAKLTASDGDANDRFGFSVSISEEYAIVGAWESAYIFERSGSDWNQVVKLIASDGAVVDWFGNSVSISGGYAIVGAYKDDDKGTRSGSAYIFERSGSNWNEVAKLTASDGAADDSFGSSVSISGGYAIVGTPFDDDIGSNSGAAYIFERSGSNWNQVAKLTGSDGLAYWFGYSVSISGVYAIVGCGAAGFPYIFEKIGNSWNRVSKLTTSDGLAYWFGYSVSISGVYAIVGTRDDDDNGLNSGSAYIFKRSGNRWNQVAKLTAIDGAPNDRFGSSVSISGGYAIVGTPYDADNGRDSGSAYIFDLTIPGDIAMPWMPLLLLDN